MRYRVVLEVDELGPTLEHVLRLQGVKVAGVEPREPSRPPRVHLAEAKAAPKTKTSGKLTQRRSAERNGKLVLDVVRQAIGVDRPFAPKLILKVAEQRGLSKASTYATLSGMVAGGKLERINPGQYRLVEKEVA